MLTVVTPANPRRLATSDDVIAVVPGLSADAANKLIDRATLAIEGWCGRSLVRETVRQTERDVRADGIMLDRWPATVTAVTVDGETVAPGDRELDGTVLRRLADDRRVWWRGSKIVIDYAAGYSPVPADLVEATVRLCVAMNGAAGRDAAIRSENIPDVMSVSYLDPGAGGGALPEAVTALLTPYREVRI